MDHIEEILHRVPCRADHNTDNEEEGRADIILSENAEMGGFSCIPWTENALRSLRDEGVINVTRDISKSASRDSKRQMIVIGAELCCRSDRERGQSAGWPRGCQADGGERLWGNEGR